VKLAIQSLGDWSDVRHIERIPLARQHEVGAWLRALCNRQEVISRKEAEKIGQETVFLLAQTRGTEWKRWRQNLGAGVVERVFGEKLRQAELASASFRSCGRPGIRKGRPI
jgi:hypothetical protein